MKMAIEVFEEGISSAPCTLKEVLAAMNLENLRGFDLDLPAILELFLPEQVIENIGEMPFPQIPASRREYLPLQGRGHPAPTPPKP